MTEFLGIPVFYLDTWVQQWVDTFVASYRPVFQMLRFPIEQLLNWVYGSLAAFPPALLMVALAAAAWYRRGFRFAAFVLVATFVLGWLGLWSEALRTVSIVATSVAFAMLIGVPIGILLAESPTAWKVGKPILDVMQTTPSFVYLVPVVMLFGIGTVPGAIATLIFATPPLIKLTQLGIARVPSESTEAGIAFGATRLQLLVHVKLPLAIDTIRAGINQTLLLAIVMSSIAAMIGAEGLGLVVLRGISRLDVGMAVTGGIGLILVALMLDGLTQSNPGGKRGWRIRLPGLKRDVASAAAH